MAEKVVWPVRDLSAETSIWREIMRLHGVLVGLFTAVVFSAGATSADEVDAQRILRAMSDYLAELEDFSFDYDSSLEVVTIGGEKIGLAQSGTVAVVRPGKILATRLGGFTDLQMAFDGTTFAVADGDSGLYTQVEIPGDIDGLVDALRDTYGRPLPAADLLVSDPFSVLMDEVTEVKDLGSGVIGGLDCDHLAFRNAEVDWQIWIAQGDMPRPCALVITSRDVDKAPQYRVTMRDWRETAGDAAFTLSPEGRTEVDFETFSADAPTFPGNFTLEGDQ
jgi:hypothetical protein